MTRASQAKSKAANSDAAKAEAERLLGQLAGPGIRTFASEAEAREVLRQRLPATLDLFEAIVAIGQVIGKEWQLALPADDRGVLRIENSGFTSVEIPAADAATAENDETQVARALGYVSAYVFDRHLDALPEDLPALSTPGGKRLIEAARARAAKRLAAAEFFERASAVIEAALVETEATMKLLAEIGFTLFRGQQPELDYQVSDAIARIRLVNAGRQWILAPIARADFLESTEGELTATFRTLNKKDESKQSLSQADLVVATVKAMVKCGLVAPFHMVDGSEEGERDAARLGPVVMKALNMAFQRTRNRLEHVAAMRKKCEKFTRTVPAALKPLLDRVKALGLTSRGDQLRIEIRDVQVWPNDYRLEEWQKPASIACICFSLPYVTSFSLYPDSDTDRVRMIAGHPIDHDASLPELGSFAYDDVDGMSVAILGELVKLKQQAA